MRTWEAAKSLGISNREFLARAERMGHHIENFMAQVSEEIVEMVKADLPQSISDEEIRRLRPFNPSQPRTCTRTKRGSP